jgi:hypothetical protein
MKMEATPSSETSVDFQRYILGDKVIYDLRCENLKSYV